MTDNHHQLETPDIKFRRGDDVQKIRGSQWKGRVVGEYSTALTPEGYAVESSTELGSVQIYPAAALELVSLNVITVGKAAENTEDADAAGIDSTDLFAGFDPEEH